MEVATAMTAEFERNRPDYSEKDLWEACCSLTNQSYMSHQLVFDTVYRDGFVK